MRILFVYNAKIPVSAYGGTERIIWWLGKSLHSIGHEISYLVKKGSECPFGKVFFLDEKKPLAQQIPDDVDLVHLHCEANLDNFPKPVVVTIHSNYTEAQTFHPNSVFLSANHAQRHGAKIYVHNGLDFDDYGSPLLEMKRNYVHFLGNAAWQVKNVRGAMEIAEKAGERLHVLGGTRVNFRKGLRITLSPHVRFHGMVEQDGKNALLNGSKGLLFPVIWHEPFGLAIIESLYFGCPVFGTPYGSLPELLGGRRAAPGNGQVEALYSEFGFLSIKKSELVDAVKQADGYDRARCQEYVIDNFSATRMSIEYLMIYEKVLSGESLHASAPVCPALDDKKYLPLGD